MTLHISRLSTLTVALCVAVIPLAACLEAYPHNMAPVTPVENMSQKQRIAALNDAGKLRYLEQRWRYRLNKQCELRITNGRWLSAHHSEWIPLRESWIARGFDKSDKTHDIFLEPAPTGDTPAKPQTLLAGAHWADAVHIMSLAQHIQRDCANKA